MGREGGMRGEGGRDERGGGTSGKGGRKTGHSTQWNEDKVTKGTGGGR